MAPKLGEETVPPGEAALLEKLIVQNLALLDEREKPVRRGQHPKQHGCVRAQFIVANLPQDLRHGLFAKPHTFDAVIRFSNGASRDDRKGDAHGMAIKLFGVPGKKLLEPCETHDFVLLDHPVFFVRNVVDYVALFKSVLEAKNSVLPGLLFFLPHAWVEQGLVFAKFLAARPHELAILSATLASLPHSPLAAQYWSTTAYKFGDTAARFTARPNADSLPKLAGSNSPDKLRIALAEQLSKGDATFDFMAQLQTDAEKMPIEDPTIDWDEKLSPWRKLATIRIPQQKFDAPEIMEFSENLSFNPWRCIEDHRPLGGINRARKLIYDAISMRRHELNGVKVKEPAFGDYTKLLG